MTTQMTRQWIQTGAGSEFANPEFRTVGRFALRVIFRMPPHLRERFLFGTSRICLPLQKLLVRLLGGAFLVQTRFTEGPMCGQSFVCSTSEKYFLLGSHHERDEQRLLLEILRSGDIVYDIGGHAGYTTLFFSAMIGPSGRVYTFEPSPVNFPRARDNVEANGRSNVTVLNLAASDQEGAALLDERGSESAIVGTTNEASNRLSRIQTMRLDDFVFRDGNPPPTCIKIDIEGHAGRALEGMRRILEVACPKIICEFHNTDEEEHVTRILASHRYDVAPIDRGQTFPRRVIFLPE